jgi:LysM repeat protein
VIDGGRSPARRAATFRRRRLAVLVVAVAVGLLAVLGALTVVHAAQGLVQPSAPAVSGVPAAAHTVVVQPGDTLWTIAERLPHHGDVRALVDRLAARNGGSQIHPGQRLVVPGG